MFFSEMMSKHRSFKSVENGVGFDLSLDNLIKMSACDQGADSLQSLEIQEMRWRSLLRDTSPVLFKEVPH